MVAEDLAFLRAVDLVEADTLRIGVVQNFDSVAVRTPTTRPVNSVAKTELVTRSVRRTAQRQRMDRMLAGLSRHGEGTTIGSSVGRGFGRG